MAKDPEDKASLSAVAQSSSGKMLSVMDLFTPDQVEWTVDEAAVALRQSQSTVYRYFRTLAAVGLVFSIRPGRYLLGPGIIHYGRQQRISDPLISATQPVLARLAGTFEESGALFIARLYRNHVMTMFEYPFGNFPFTNAYDPGKFMQIENSAPALSILAYMSPRTVRKEIGVAIEGASPDGAGRWASVKRQLRKIRVDGFATLPDPDGAPTAYLSVPLMQANGDIAGSLNLGVQAIHLTRPFAEMAAAKLANTAREISAAMPEGNVSG